MRRRLGAIGSALLVVLALLSGCRSASGARNSDPVGTGASAERLYVSIGDSYAAGYQPLDADSGRTTTDGFAYQIAAISQGTSTPLQLLNFGCSGVTSSVAMNNDGCDDSALGPGAVPYDDRTQVDAAVSAIEDHAGSIALVTIVLGGNDVQNCLFTAGTEECLATILPVLQQNITELVTRVRDAAGDDVPVIGLTYPDPFLAEWMQSDTASKQIAVTSRELFRTYLNPTLSAAYAAGGADFIDITALSGAYGDDTVTTTVNPYGELPVPVAKVCQLTYYCQYKDVHPTTAGYALIAGAVLDSASSGR